MNKNDIPENFLSIVETSDKPYLRLTSRKFIATNEITYLESEVNYTHVHTCDNQKYLSSFTLKTLQQRIVSDLFLRINRSYLVNTEYIKKLHFVKNDCQVILLNDTVLTVSRRKYIKIRQNLNLIIGHNKAKM